jgi:hypothetical protein
MSASARRGCSHDPLREPGFASLLPPQIPRRRAPVSRGDEAVITKKRGGSGVESRPTLREERQMSQEAGATDDSAIRPFTIDVSDEELEDLRSRINAKLERWLNGDSRKTLGSLIELFKERG